MAPSESQKRASLKWDKENMIVLGCKVKKSQAAAFKAYCDAQGKTSNTVLKDYVLECIGQQDKTPLSPTETPTTHEDTGAVSLPSEMANAATEDTQAAGEGKGGEPV